MESMSILVATVEQSEGSSHAMTKYSTGKTQETVVHELTDNGVGGFGAYGTVNYAGKSLNVKLVSLDSKTEGYKSDYEESSAFDDPVKNTKSGSDSKKGGEYVDNAVSEEILAQSTVTVSYCKDFASTLDGELTIRPPVVSIDLCPYTSDYVVPGSVRFTWMGHVFEDYEGILIRGRTANSVGFVAGAINYSSGIAQVTDYVVSGLATDFTLNSLWTVRQKWNTASVFLRTQSAPIKPGGFVINIVDVNGDSLSATAGTDGKLSGDHIRGNVEYASGIVEIQFGDYVRDSSLTAEQKAEWWYNPDEVVTEQQNSLLAGKIWKPWPIDPTTVRYNSVTFAYLPLDAGILGLDPVRLPSDGKVPIFRPGGFAVIGHTGEITTTVGNGQTIDCGRVRLSRVRVVGYDGAVINTGFTADLEAGTVTFTNVSGYSQPVTIQHRIEDMAVVSDVQINGDISFTRSLTHDYPANESYISSAMVSGDLFAQANTIFDQSTWNGTYSNQVSGSAATGTFNASQYPIVVTNRGALTERWAIQFTNSTSFNVLGEHVGVIAVGNTTSDCAPINPATGAPYFTIPALGWGSGWATGNVLRFNTIGAIFPVWVVRTVQQGPETITDDKFTLLVRGDVNTP